MDDKFIFFRKTYKLEQIFLISLFNNIFLLFDFFYIFGFNHLWFDLFFKIYYTILIIYGFYCKFNDYTLKKNSYLIYFYSSIVVYFINIIFEFYLFYIIIVYLINNKHILMMSIFFILLLLAFIIKIRLLFTSLRIIKFWKLNPNYFIAKHDNNQINN